MQQTTRQMPGPLATPKAFRRPIGAHAILVWLGLADLCGIVLWLLAGALLTPLIWLIIQHILPILHFSLLLDSGVVLILATVAFGLLRRRIQKRAKMRRGGAPARWRSCSPLPCCSLP
jgi:hypothetical protein